MTRKEFNLARERRILTARVRAGLSQSDFARVFNVNSSTFGKHERLDSPLYEHAVNGYVWDNDPLSFIKTMVKAGKAPECMIDAYKKWYAENA